MRALLDGSEIRESHREGDTRVQDPYCIRCQPQVTGAAMDVLRMAARTLEIEANAATDNPLVLADGQIVSGGNFHAEPVGFAADMIALAIGRDRRHRPAPRGADGRPDAQLRPAAFLTPNPGLNSGLMIAEVTTAALMSENKHLAHPTVTDSTPTSANQEDHVRMAAHGARRLTPMVDEPERHPRGRGDVRRARHRIPRAADHLRPARTRARRGCAHDVADARRGPLPRPRPRRRRPPDRQRRLAAAGIALPLLLLKYPAGVRGCNAPALSATPELDHDQPRHNLRDVFPATGTEITAKSWLTEAPMRMLMNNLHPDVAENPHELVVYGGIGRAARTWEDFDRIVATLKTLEDDETLLVQSGKPVGVFRTHTDAPRVLIANSNLVPHWATWDHFNELDSKGLAMYGQMTAGSWIYIGTQGIVQGTYETFAEAGRQHYGGNLTRQLDPDRRPWRHGRRAAARRRHGRGLLPRRRVRRDPDRFPHPHQIPRRQGPTRWMKRWR